MPSAEPSRLRLVIEMLSSRERILPHGHSVHASIPAEWAPTSSPPLSRDQSGSLLLTYVASQLPHSRASDRFDTIGTVVPPLHGPPLQRWEYHLTPPTPHPTLRCPCCRIIPTPPQSNTRVAVCCRAPGKGLPWLQVFPVKPGWHLHLSGPTHSPCLQPGWHRAIQGGFKQEERDQRGVLEDYLYNIKTTKHLIQQLLDSAIHYIYSKWQQKRQHEATSIEVKDLELQLIRINDDGSTIILNQLDPCLHLAARDSGKIALSSPMASGPWDDWGEK